MKNISKLKFSSDWETIIRTINSLIDAYNNLEAIHFIMESRNRYREALEKIAEYEMPRLQIKEVSIEQTADLCHCIQDMAGIAKSALNKGEKK